MSGVFDSLYLASDANIRVPSLNVRSWLCNGELRHWDGPVESVHSATYWRTSDAHPNGSESRIAIGSFPLLSADEAREAVESAKAAFAQGRGAWPQATPQERIVSMEKLLDGLRKHKGELVNMIMWEISKSQADAEKEVVRTIDYIADTVRDYKSLVNKEGQLSVDSGFVAKIRRVPLGVTLVLPPFNYPLNEGATLFVPALLMGNTVVMKTPRPGALLNAVLYPVFRDAFPPGVINIISGSGRTLLPPLMASGAVDVLALIGGSSAAQALLRQHPKPNRLRMVLGLEAKNPAIVFPDADLAVAVRECVAGSLAYDGMRCTAIKIIHVHASIADAFVTRLAAAVDALRMGLPWESGVQITPLPEDGKVGYLQEVVADAVAKGARIANARGGQSDRSWFAPTVLFPVDDRMRAFHEEQFGPLVPVRVWNQLDEVFADLEASPYGQQAAVFSTSAEHVGQAIDVLAHLVSRININTQCQRGPDSFPFTARKDSAAATLSVYDALRTFSIRTTVATKENAENHTLLTQMVKKDTSKFMSFDYLL